MRRILVLITLLLVFTQACNSASVPPVDTMPAASEFRVSPSTSSIAPSQEVVKTTLSPPTPTTDTVVASLPTNPTLTACMYAGGTVKLEHFTTDLLTEPLVYHIYLPPCYDEQTERSYPVLYLVHGKNATDSQWVYLGVPGVLNRLIPTGEMPPFIIVMPRDSVWAEPTVDTFGEALVQSLVPWVDEHYRTLPEREYRAIGGLSWGGAWALHIGFSHPELFGAIGSHSGIVFNTDVVNFYGWLSAFPDGMTPRIYMDIGDQDRADTIKEASWVESMLTKNNIPHEWHLYEGKHDDTYWRAHVEEYLRWYSQDWFNVPAPGGG